MVHRADGRVATLGYEAFVGMQRACCILRSHFCLRRHERAGVNAAASAGTSQLPVKDRAITVAWKESSSPYVRFRPLADVTQGARAETTANARPPTRTFGQLYLRIWMGEAAMDDRATVLPSRTRAARDSHLPVSHASASKSPRTASAHRVHRQVHWAARHQLF